MPARCRYAHYRASNHVLGDGATGLGIGVPTKTRSNNQPLGLGQAGFQLRRATVTPASELPDSPRGVRPMVSAMPQEQSDAAGRGTDGRSPRATLEQRRAGNPQGVRSLAAPK